MQNTTIRRVSAALFTCALVSLGLVACAGGSTQTSGNKVEIQYLHRLPDGAGMTKVADIVAKWNKENPNISVKAVKFDGKAEEMTKKLETDIKAGSGPCLAQLEYFEIPNMFVRGMLTDVTKQAEKYKDKFELGAYQMAGVAGKTFGLPQDTGPLVYYYNKAEFDKLGIVAPKTWDEFKTAAAKAKANGKYIADFQPDQGIPWLSGQAAAMGASWYNVNGNSWKVTVTDEATKKLAALWEDLFTKDQTLRLERFSDSFTKAVMEHKLIGTIGAGWEAALIAGDPKNGGHKGTVNDGQWRVAPLPTFDGKPSSGPYGGSAVAVMKGCAHPDEAMQFNAWFNTQIEGLVSQGLVVAAKGKMATPENVKKFFGGQDVMEELAKANAVMKPISYIPTFASLRTPTSQSAAKAAKNEIPVGKIFENIQNDSIKTLKDTGLSVGN